MPLTDRDTDMADEALQVLRRATLSRSVRGNVRWLLRAIGWGSIVYMIAWTIVLVIAAVQSLDPLAPAVTDALTRWLPAAGAAALALVLHGAARAHVTPVWLDRRDLSHLAPGAATPRAVLRWPAWRAALAPVLTAVAFAGVIALVVPPLLGSSGLAALLTLPALAMLVPTLRWRAAGARGRDRLAWAVAGVAWFSAAAAASGAWFGLGGWGTWAAAPVHATFGLMALTPSLVVGAVVLVAAIVLALRTIAATTDAIPGVVLRQSLLLGELRAIATLRGLSVLTMTAVDPGAGFASRRLRDELRGSRNARSPRWRPAIPRRGGATTAFAWLGVVRAWRSSPWTVVAIVPVCVAAVAAVPAGGPLGGASLLPSLAVAWVAAQLHPGRMPWPGFAVDARARTLAAVLVVAVPMWVVATLAGIARPALGMPAVADDWLMIPLALAAGAVVDLFGAQAASTRNAGVWLTAGVLLAAPAAILGWAGLDSGTATPLLAAVWAGTAWLRVLMAPPVG